MLSRSFEVEAHGSVEQMIEILTDLSIRSLGYRIQVEIESDKDPCEFRIIETDTSSYAAFIVGKIIPQEAKNWIILKGRVYPSSSSIFVSLCSIAVILLIVMVLLLASTSNKRTFNSIEVIAAIILPTISGLYTIFSVNDFMNKFVKYIEKVNRKLDKQAAGTPDNL